MRPFWIASIWCLCWFQSCWLAHAQHWQWKRLADFPNTVGVASPLAGNSYSTLLVAGGANFPDKRPWEGGKKVWHDEVFALTNPNGQWSQIGNLPRPLAYGISVSWKESILSVGGSDEQGHFGDVYRLRYVENQLKIDRLADLPATLANACGAIVDGVFVISGGLIQPDALECENRTWALDLESLDSKEGSRWRELPPLPATARMLSTAASDKKVFWAIGGTALSGNSDGKPVRMYLKECWKLQLDRTSFSGTWTRLADLPSALVASPGPAIVKSDRIWIFGGDDGSQVGVAPSEHQGFSKKIYSYEISENRWSVSDVESPVARVTVPLTAWADGWVITSGEAKPGIRSPEIWWVGEGN